MNLKKLCFVMDSFGVGGVEINRTKIMNYFVSLGHDVTLICLLRGGETVKNLDSQIHVVHLSCDYLRVAAPCKLWNHLRKNKYDIVISAKELANMVTMLSIMLLPKFKCNKPKTVLSTHIALSAQKKNTSSRLLKQLFIIMPFFYKRADKLVCVSNAGSRDIEKVLKLPENCVKTIYNPVVKTEWLNYTPEKRPHAWLNKNRKYKVFIACGRLTYQKNFQLLINAFAKAYAKNKDIRLIIIGKGEDQDSLEQLIHKHNIGSVIDLVGQKLNVIDYLYFADMFVLSSRYEGLPTVLIESFAMGTPVISVDCPTGPSEIITSHENGILIENNNEDILCEAILRAHKKKFSSKKECREIAKNYSVNKQAPKYIEF